MSPPRRPNRTIAGGPRTDQNANEGGARRRLTEMRRRPVARSEEPYQLGEQYHKARSKLALFSGLLLGWEIIGVELAGRPLTSIQITLKSPQAAPYIFIALIAYFTFRLTVEWLLCAPGQRRAVPARADYYGAHGIAIAALLLYLLQRLLGVQIADSLSRAPIIALIAGAGLGVAVFFFRAAIRLWKTAPGLRDCSPCMGHSACSAPSRRS